MAIQSRENALQGEYVRLYHTFIKDGMLSDPADAPMVYIVDSSYDAVSSSSSSSPAIDSLGSGESSSSSTEVLAQTTTGFGPLRAQRENTGVWYVDWQVPDTLAIGAWYDVWKFHWESGGVLISTVGEFEVYAANVQMFWISPNVSTKISDTVAGMINDLVNDFLFEAQHIPEYREQAFPVGDGHTYQVAYKNWNNDPRPMIYVNNHLMLDGWTTNFNGEVRFARTMDPEDFVEVSYSFRYFSDEEMLDFLVAGMNALNATAPVTDFYTDLNATPYYWRAGVILYAAMTGIQRLIYGLNFQEKSIIFGEDWNIVNAKIANLSKFYADYSKTWDEFKKDIKTNRLPQIAQISVPEYTLPGGRSRWFRYLYK